MDFVDQFEPLTVNLPWILTLVSILKIILTSTNFTNRPRFKVAFLFVAVTTLNLVDGYTIKVSKFLYTGSHFMFAHFLPIFNHGWSM